MKASTRPKNPKNLTVQIPEFKMSKKVERPCARTSLEEDFRISFWDEDPM